MEMQLAGRRVGGF